MRQRLGIFACCLLLILTVVHFGCAETAVNGAGDGSENNNGGNNGGGDGDGDNNNPAVPAVPVAFTPVGASIANSLIDLEFLPGQNGESIVISQDGNVYYLDGNFNQVGSAVFLPVTYSFDERGLLNVVADPLYGTSNTFVYFYYTVQGSSPDINRVERYTVLANSGAGTFQLQDARRIMQFQKTTNADNHNGGSMAFMSQDELAIGVGEGADTPNLAQDPNSRLGKIHRIIPDRTAGGETTTQHFSIPADQQVGQPHNASTTEPSIFSLGVRNPFTIVVDEDGDLFFGDVGQDTFEELDCAYAVEAPENYGWPTCEGPCSGHPEFRNPTHGYRHGDATFDNEDPAVNPTGSEAIMMNAFYQGTQYNGGLTDKFIYSEFYHGWVRALKLTAADLVESDEPIGHLEGLVSLHVNPVDGMLYGVSLFGSDSVQRDHVLRMDLAN